MLSYVLLLGFGSLLHKDNTDAISKFSSECSSYEVASEGVPAIFKEPKCLGSVKLPPKPTPIPSIPDFPDLPLPPPFSCTFGTNQIPVHNCTQLTSAVASAGCGTDIVLAPGTYSCNIQMNKTCTTSSPITIRSETALAATFTGQIALAGSGNQVANLYFNGTGANVRVGGTNNKVIGNRFHGWSTAAAIFLTSGSATEVAYNEITDPASWSEVPPTGVEPVRMGIRSGYKPGAENFGGNGFHSSAWVHHNYLLNLPDKPGENYHSGQTDAIEVCATQPKPEALASNWLLENNLIENHLEHGAGIVDVKCSTGAVVRNNTIVDAVNGGRLDFRGGNGGFLVGNYLNNTGGINVAGDNHLVKDNLVTGGGIIGLVTGSVSSDTAAANNTTVVCNNGRLVLGVYSGSGKTPVSNTRVINHTGSVILESATGTVQSHDGTVCTPPHKLTAAEVGLSALAVKCGN